LSDAQAGFPDELFYGYCQLSRRPGWQVDLVERRFPSRLGHRVQNALHWLTHLSPDFGNLGGLSRSLLERYDAVVSVSEPVLLTLALRKRGPSDGAALVLIYIGGEKRLRRSRAPALTRRLLRFLFERLAFVIVLGEGDRAFLVEERLIAPERVRVIQFGVDEAFWRPAGTPAPGDYVLSLGNDDGRDYRTLLAAIGGVPLRLHTALPLPSGLPPNVALTRGSWHERTLSDAEVRELYQRARFVVTPLTDSWQPQGQSVTLQAMACGKAVVLSRTRGLWSPLLMRHAENCWLVPPGDAAALKEAVQRLWADGELAASLGAAARESVVAHFTSRRMADEIGDVLKRSAPQAGPQEKAHAGR
jgi:glycosyltransferase involved in cell wall biosynthesis